MRIRSAFLLQLATAVVPSLILLCVVPHVRSRLSLDAFAGFTVIVSSISFLTMLDGGLGRATTYLISVARSKGGIRRARATLLGSMGLGAVFALIVMAAGSALIGFQTKGSFVTARGAIYILLLFAPAFVCGLVFRGALEGQQRFGLSTTLQLAYGTIVGVAPLVVIKNSADLASYAWVVGAARTALALALFRVTGLAAPVTRRLMRASVITAGRLFRYSKWLLLSNIVGLCIIYADRFVITRYFGSDVVAAYVLPMEMISRGQLLVSAFCSVMFPRLVMHFQRATGRDLAGIIGDAQALAIAANIAAGFLAIPVAEPLLRWWLGPNLSMQASEVALVGIVGLALISCSSITMLAINGMGHTRQVAGLHFLELPLYLALLYVVSRTASLHWLLAAWLTRLLFDAFAMALISRSVARRFSGRVRPAGGAAPFGAGKSWYWRIVPAVLAMVLLAVIFRGPSISMEQKLYWAITGVAATLATLLVFVRRLRTAMSQAAPVPIR
jgi:O-antigen/teichoic acid export membrane protein